MIIDFDNINKDVIKNFKGGEKDVAMRAFTDQENRIMRCALMPGASIGMHTHETNREIMFIVKGTGHIIENGTKTTVSEGMCSYCPKGGSHSLVNDSDDMLVFYAVVAE